MNGAPRMNWRMWTTRPGEPDRYGGRGPSTQVLEESPCYWWATRGRDVVDADRTVVLSDEQAMVPHGADIRAGDEIVRLVDPFGRVVWDTADGIGHARHIEYVHYEPSHLEVSLEAAT